MSQDESSLKNTPLHAKHIDLGARMVPFSGWNMPVQYTGIIEEHMHTREKAGLFDICHMGEFFLKGDTAAIDVERLFTRKVDDMDPGRCRYGFLLNDSGGVIDDIIVYKISEDNFMFVVNAGTIEKDKAWITGQISPDTEFIDKSDDTAKLDLQGPESAEVLKKLVDPSELEEIKRFSFKEVEIEGSKVLLSRTGYTGELGYELFFAQAAAGKIWDALMACDGVKPVGLGARDTLRMEMGYPLYGNDIDEDRTPVEAGLSKFVAEDKDFIGKDVLMDEKESGPGSVLTGFVCEGRRSARGHFKVQSEGETVGEVTSGSFSPCLKKGIGLCYISKGFSAEGTEIVLTDGKVEIKAVIKKPPLLSR